MLPTTLQSTTGNAFTVLHTFDSSAGPWSLVAEEAPLSSRWRRSARISCVRWNWSFRFHRCQSGPWRRLSESSAGRSSSRRWNAIGSTGDDMEWPLNGQFGGGIARMNPSRST
uniref:Uncharacterized protein n=1 Tax=Triticum urartu TaxID=4572 RepID=A0A8R7PUN5_TRIUA